MKDDFFELKCPNCGDKVTITEKDYDEYFLEFGNVSIYLGAEGKEEIKCQSCKTEFVRRSQCETYASAINVFNQSGQTVHGTQTNVVIGNGARNVAIGSNIKLNNKHW